MADTFWAALPWVASGVVCGYFLSLPVVFFVVGISWTLFFWALYKNPSMEMQGWFMVIYIPRIALFTIGILTTAFIVRIAQISSFIKRNKSTFKFLFR